jgi:hypothetical protein
MDLRAPCHKVPHACRGWGFFLVAIGGVVLGGEMDQGTSPHRFLLAVLVTQGVPQGRRKKQAKGASAAFFMPKTPDVTVTKIYTDKVGRGTNSTCERFQRPAVWSGHCALFGRGVFGAPYW